MKEKSEWREMLRKELERHVEKDRLAQLERVLLERTRALTVVTEDLYQAHNGAAVLRACDNFGIQDVHAFCDRNAFRVDETVAAGAERWVDVHHAKAREGTSISDLASSLKSQGYRVVATTLRPGSIPLDSLAVDSKLAIMFGTEEQGLTDAAHEAADTFVWLPMYGFTQSFNISVSLALTLFNLSQRMRNSSLAWELPDQERDALRLRWLCNMNDDMHRRSRSWLLQRNVPSEQWPVPFE